MSGRLSTNAEVVISFDGRRIELEHLREFTQCQRKLVASKIHATQIVVRFRLIRIKVRCFAQLALRVFHLLQELISRAEHEVGLPVIWLKLYRIPQGLRGECPLMSFEVEIP